MIPFHHGAAWQAREDLNPHQRVWNPRCYRYTTRLRIDATVSGDFLDEFWIVSIRMLNPVTDSAQEAALLQLLFNNAPTFVGRVPYVEFLFSKVMELKTRLMT